MIELAEFFSIVYFYLGAHFDCAFIVFLIFCSYFLKVVFVLWFYFLVNEVLRIVVEDLCGYFCFYFFFFCEENFSSL